MVFDVRFGLPGFVVLILLLAAIPVMVALIGWLLQELRQARTLLQHRRHTVLPPPSHNREQEAYRIFISTISHQTSNSLQAILGALANLRFQMHDEPGNAVQLDSADELHYLVQVEAETRYLLDLTNKLRLLAQLEIEEAPIAVQPVQLRAIIADVIMETATRAGEQGIELLYHGPARPPRVLADRTQITIALQNLVDNSLKYARPESCEVVLGLAVEDGCLSISVADDGIGIPSTVLPHILDSAYRAPDPRARRRDGSGLGLAIVHRIVERHGGQVNVQSTYGQGTVVTFTLPKTTFDEV